MSKPLISIVIPTHNSAHMISGAIRSCFTQTLRDFEIIVVDDGRSTDSIESVFAAFAGRETRLIRGFRGTAAAARNGGVSAARGEYIAFLDAKDEFVPNLISCLSVLQRDANAVVYSVHRGVSRLWVLPARGLREGEDISEDLLLHKGWVYPTTVMRRADVARAQVRQMRKRSRAVASARQELGRAA